MLRRVIKHSEVEAEYTKEELNLFYNSVKTEFINRIFEDPFEHTSLSEWYNIDDKNYPVPKEFVKKMEIIQEEEYQKSIVRVFDYSVIEDLI